MPLATVMLCHDKLLKLKVPCTTQTLLLAGFNCSETLKGAPTVLFCDAGKTDNIELSARAIWLTPNIPTTVNNANKIIFFIYLFYFSYPS